jgi:hypothetical protein
VLPLNQGPIQINHAFAAFELPDLDRSEIEQLFRRVGKAGKDDQDDLERVSLGHRLAGFNFRQVLGVLAQVTTSDDISERTIRQIAADRCDIIHSLVREISPKADILPGLIFGQVMSALGVYQKAWSTAVVESLPSQLALWLT